MGCPSIKKKDIRPDSGAVAQLEEQLLCKQQVVGSNPSGSTKPGP